MLEHGIVLWFDRTKGHGMIQFHGDEQVLVHLDSVESDTRRGLCDGQSVEFSLESGPQGRFASHVRVIGDPPVQTTKQ
jgi:CspA family cold shock protein